MAVAATDPTHKKYVVMENVLNDINKRVIALQEKEKKRNNVILNLVVNIIVDIMKQKDPLFRGLFREKYYGGSFYDNLKVGNPNEFDLDLILVIPVVTEPRVKCSVQPGFVHVEVKNHLKILNRPEKEKAGFEKLSSLLDQNNFLSTQRVLKWMESVIKKAINEIAKDDKETFIDAALDPKKPDQLSRIYAKIAKGGPAFTFKLSGKEEDGTEFNLDIDLVPCFQFDEKNWPDKAAGYRANTSSTKTRFLVVPKKPKEKYLENAPNVETYWRLSFQEQERDLIGDGKKYLKPSLRILKKLRDKHNHKIASYFIKTIYLWTVEKEPVTFWDKQLSVTVMLMLKKYAEYLRSSTIPYFWNPKYNLIGCLKSTTISDIANTILNIIGSVDKALGEGPLCDPYVIGKYLLPKDEYEKLKSEVKLGKKTEKQIQIATTQKILNSPFVSVSADLTSSIPLNFLGFDANSIEFARQFTDKSSTNEILNLPKNINDKIDKLEETVDKIKEDIKENINVRLTNLEDKIIELELENRQLKNQLNKPNNNEINCSVDDLLEIRQI